MSKIKGCGKTTNAAINIGQRAKLILWCSERAGDARSYSELSQAATNDMGFTVTSNVLQNHWTAVHGKRNVTHQKTSIESLVKRIERLESIVRNMAEKQLSIPGINT